MSERENESGGEATRQPQAKQERGALVFTLVTVGIIALVGFPCFCYFGAGLFHGVHILQTGHQVNPARQPMSKKRQKRDPKYNRTFPTPSEERVEDEPDMKP